MLGRGSLQCMLLSARTRTVQAELLKMNGARLFLSVSQQVSYFLIFKDTHQAMISTATKFPKVDITHYKKWKRESTTRFYIKTSVRV